MSTADIIDEFLTEVDDYASDACDALVEAIGQLDVPALCRLQNSLRDERGDGREE